MHIATHAWRLVSDFVIQILSRYTLKLVAHSGPRETVTR